MTPGDQVKLSHHARAVTVAGVEGDQFWYFITPGGAEQRCKISDALEVIAGPVGVAELRDRQEACRD
jgi:hypothetical protein